MRELLRPPARGEPCRNIGLWRAETLQNIECPPQWSAHSGRVAGRCLLDALLSAANSDTTPRRAALTDSRAPAAMEAAASPRRAGHLRCLIVTELRFQRVSAATAPTLHAHRRMTTAIAARVSKVSTLLGSRPPFAAFVICQPRYICSLRQVYESRERQGYARRGRGGRAGKIGAAARQRLAARGEASSEAHLPLPQLQKRASREGAPHQL